MAKLVNETHPALHEIAREVPLGEIESASIQKIVKDMKRALIGYEVEGFNGVAIAAPQIGIPLRIFLVFNTSTDKKEQKILPELVAINPVIVKVSKTRHTVGEGCLSVPTLYGAVSRATKAIIRAYDEHGLLYERGASGLLAQIFQHEVDHLDGILFTERASRIYTKEEMDRAKLHEADPEPDEENI